MKDRLEELLALINNDIKLYDSFALNIIWDTTRTKIEEINWINVSKIREGKGKFKETYWISDDWNNLKEYPKWQYPKFDMNNRNKPSQIYYSKGCLSVRRDQKLNDLLK